MAIRFKNSQYKLHNYYLYFPEEVENSEYETLACSESDRESEYMTGVEDLFEANTEVKKTRKRKRVLTPVNEIIKSSFIQNILFEDSRAGVEVVDLFVAVKNAKDKLEYLAKCNSDISVKLNDLNEEAKVFKNEYRNFLGNVEDFMAKMNADYQLWHVMVPQVKQNAAKQPDGKHSKTVGKESEDKRQSLVSAKKCETQTKQSKRALCKSCGREEVQNYEDSTESRKADGSRGETANTLGCFMSSLKKNSFDKLPVFSEAFLGSFAASLFWLQKKQERSSSKSRSSSHVELAAEGEKGTDFLQLKDSTVQMIRDVCEIVKEAPCEANRQLFLKEAEKADNDLEVSSGASCESVLEDRGRAPDIGPKGARKETESDAGHVVDDISCVYGGENPSSKLQTCGKQALKKSKSENVSKFLASGRIKEGQNSDSEETSAADPLATPTHYDLKAKPSVTCMGDLTSSLTKKKSIGALSSAISVMPWIEKLSTEIISKLKNIKPKANIKVFEQPYEKSDLGLQALTGYLEFTVKANTPMGVLDFNVVHYNKNPSLSERMLKFNTTPAQVNSGPKPTPASQLSGRMTSIKEDSYSWSEESFRNSESDGVSNSGESELEEFVQIFLESPKKNTKKGKMQNLPQVKGTLKEAELKIGKSHFFEIQKCYPVYHVEDLFQATPKIQRGGRPEVKKMVSEEKTLSVNAGEKCESQLVIEGSSTDLVIYIQVEVEEGGNIRQLDDGTTMEYQTAKTASKEKTIRLDERKESGFSLFSIWKGEKNSTDLENTEKLIALEEMQFEEAEMENELSDEEEKVVMVKEPKEKSVTFNDELSEIYIEKELEETIPEEETNEAEVLATSKDFSVKDEKQRVNIWYQQKCSIPVERGETRKAVLPVEHEDTVETLYSNSMELERALKLIREIESDVVEVKLGDAISILPRLEMELRKHLQGKLKDLGERESKSPNSLHNFFSAIDFWPDDESADNSENSEDRLNSLLIMLSNLEDAVKSIENSSSSIELSQSSKIYKLLHALTVSIRELEKEPSVVSLSHTMDIASQLDTAVREYDSIVRKQPLDYITAPKEESIRWNVNLKSIEKVPEQQHLRNVRKKVFEILEEEATDVEERIDKDFDRLDRLGRENDEALMFLEAFLQKTQRRLLELSSLKAELKELSYSMNVLYETAKEKFARKKEKEMEAEMRVIHLKDVEEQSTTTNSSVSSFGQSPIRQTVSGLLIALDALKSKAKEKKEFCKELLRPGSIEKSEEADNSSQRSSRSSFTTKHPETLRTFIREFKKIGDTSLYLSWTKPEGPLVGSVVGYQIHVNGKLNQKVRNPRRLQAVLYSVDLTNKAEIQLYAIAENGPRILLATLSHHNE